MATLTDREYDAELRKLHDQLLLMGAKVEEMVIFMVVGKDVRHLGSMAEPGQRRSRAASLGAGGPFDGHGVGRGAAQRVP